MAEAKRLADLFSAELTLIHSGEHDKSNDAILAEQMSKTGIPAEHTRVVYKTGNAPMVIAKMAKELNCDLLISGALKQETFQKYYFGSIARKLARQTDIPILLIPDPSISPKPVKKVIISINEDESQKVIEKGLMFARALKAEKIYFAKESSIKSSRNVFKSYYSEEQSNLLQAQLMEEEQEYLFRMLETHDLNGMDISSKILFGHSGVALVQFATEIEADLLVDAYPRIKLGFWDKLFPRNIEYALLNLPCKLLLIN